MGRYTKDELENTLESIASMICRSEDAQKKFATGSSHHTLQKNRIHALLVAQALVRQELVGAPVTDNYTKTDLDRARAPIASLISKSEKARTNLTPGTWQHTMLENNLKALSIAFALLEEAYGRVV